MATLCRPAIRIACLRAFPHGSMRGKQPGLPRRSSPSSATGSRRTPRELQNDTAIHSRYGNRL
jgi:hypothetical protein